MPEDSHIRRPSVLPCFPCYRTPRPRKAGIGAGLVRTLSRTLQFPARKTARRPRASPTAAQREFRSATGRAAPRTRPGRSHASRGTSTGHACGAPLTAQRHPILVVPEMCESEEVHRVREHELEPPRGERRVQVQRADTGQATAQHPPHRYDLGMRYDALDVVMWAKSRTAAALSVAQRMVEGHAFAWTRNWRGAGRERTSVLQKSGHASETSRHNLQTRVIFSELKSICSLRVETGMAQRCRREVRAVWARECCGVCHSPRRSRLFTESWWHWSAEKSVT
ncbi:hypothetical protein DFH07DRAFT_276979 [Mycena maculata]|uniref:Uncharacterized protein n=1 Tax=Mycena maculata TaxID=230809 RepID=A0AAD7HMH0_9AGAR|nr:hypothetical protein DFH07DRAFT_276979 [Mycena maculata]